MTCNHINEAKEWLVKARSWVTGTKDKPTEAGAAVRWFIPFGNTYDISELRETAQTYEMWMDNARGQISNAQGWLNNCDCEEKAASALSNFYNLDEVRGLGEGAFQNKDLMEQSNYLKSEFERIVNEKKSLSNQINSLTSQVSQLERDLQSSRQNVTSLNGNIGDLRRDKENLHTQIRNKDSNISSLNSQIDSLKTQERNLGEEIRKNKQNIENLEREKSNLQNSESNLKNEINNKDKNISSLNAEVKKDERAIGNLRIIRKDLISARKSLSADLKKNREDKKKLQEELSQFKRTIVVFGATGAGKSTFFNTLRGISDKDKDAFKTSFWSVSETRGIQFKEFVAENGIKYLLIDTEGLGDTKRSWKETIQAIKEEMIKRDYNLHEAFVLFKDRISDQVVEVFNSLKDVLGDEAVKEGRFTFVKTAFENFMDEEICEEDTKKVLSETKPEIAEIIKACGSRILYVNNPSSNLEVGSRENSTQKKLRQRQEETNRLTREESRKKMIEHLSHGTGIKISSSKENIDQKEKSYLLIGKKGVGKSTLINNILGEDSEFREISKGKSKNDCYEISLFKDEEGNEHRIVEFSVFDKAKLSQPESICDLVEAVGLEFENGINQIFFATDGELTEEEVAYFGILTTLIGDENILDYTAFVQTKFSEVENEESCRKSYQKTIEMSKNAICTELLEVLGEENFIYADNLSNNPQTRALSRTRITNTLRNSTNHRTSFLSNLGKGVKNIFTGGSNKKNQATQSAINNLVNQSPALGKVAQASHVGSQIGGSSLPLIGSPVGGLIGFGTGVVHGIVNSTVGAVSSVVGSGNSNEISRLRAENSQLKTQVTNITRQRDERPNTKLSLTQIQTLQARPDITQVELNALNSRPSQAQLESVERERNNAQKALNNRANITPGALEEERRRATQTLNNMTQERDNVNIQLTNTQSELVAVREERQKAITERDDARRELNIWSSQFPNESASQVQVRINSLSQRVKELENKLTGNPPIESPIIEQPPKGKGP